MMQVIIEMLFLLVICWSQSYIISRILSNPQTNNFHFYGHRFASL